MLMQKVLKIAYGSCLCTFYNNGKANIMIIDRFEVESEHRGKGIGTLLLQKAIELAKTQHVDSIELTVNNDNKPAKKLYKKMGFKKTDKDYYRILL